MKDWQKMTLVAVAVLGIAAAGSQRTPLNRAFLQSNLDANGFNVTNLQGGVPGSIVAYDPDNGLMPTNVAVLSNAYVTNLVTSNVYATNIYVITGYLAELTVTNGLTNLSLTPNTALKADGGRKVSSITPNAVGMLTNDGAGEMGWTLDAGLLTNVNNLSPGVSNFIAGQASATNVVWPTQGTNVFLTTNGNAVKIDVPYQTLLTNGLASTNYVNDATNNIYQAGTNYANSVTNSLKPFPSDASGALTNDGAGVLGWYPSFATQPGNNVMSGSNYFGGAVTGPTNSSGTAPDMSKSAGASLLSTNAAFAWLVPTSVDPSKLTQQWAEILVTNTTAAAVAMTVTAPCNSVGTAYVTNLTDVWVMVYPFVCTNFYFIPVR